MSDRKQGAPRALLLRKGAGDGGDEARRERPEAHGEVVAWEVLVPIVTNPCIIGDVVMFSCMAFAFPAAVIPVAANFLGYAPTRPGLLAFFGLLAIIIGAFNAAYLLFSLLGLRNRFVARFVGERASRTGIVLRAVFRAGALRTDVSAPCGRGGCEGRVQDIQVAPLGSFPEGGRP
jgi:hypothetical protein